MSHLLSEFPGFYLKCGVPEDYAKIVARVTGGYYLQLQSDARMMGLGKSSKATGAIAAAEMIIDGYLEAGIICREEDYVKAFIGACVELYSAAICAIATYSYELEMKSDEDIRRILNKTNETFNMLEQDTDNEALRNKKQYYQEKLNRTYTETISVGKALGSRKGVWSNIFG